MEVKIVSDETKMYRSKLQSAQPETMLTDGTCRMAILAGR